jgi:hypothetical protein
MPFVRAPETQVPIRKYIPSQVDDDRAITDVAQAIWRTENTLGSYLNQEQGLPDQVDDRSFNPYDYFTEEEKLDEQFVINAALADSEDEINAVRRQQARERKDRETIANGGAISVAIGLGTGIIDPINFIPIGGAVAKTYKTGSSVLRSAAVTGSVTAASTAVQEAALHSTQLERTYGESAVNVSAGALLGGALGFGVGKLAQYLDEKQIKEIANTMDVEPRILDEQDSVILSVPQFDEAAVRTSFIDELRLELTPIAGNKLSRGERKALLAERQSIQQRINAVEVVVEDLPTRKDIPARKAKQEAIKAAEQAAENERQLFRDQLNIVNQRLKADDAAKKAEANLSRLEQDIVPQEYRSRLDSILRENEKQVVATAKPGQTPSLQQEAAEAGITAKELSVGAAQVANGEEVTGKVAKFLTKAMAFDPLSRSITSLNPFTRSLANQLAENPIAMDRGGITAVESRIKIKDGRYNAALANHLDQYRAYRKAGGKLNKVKFNEAVARALRNEESDIPEALESAKIWRSELYEPLKNEAIDVGLLPEDIDVATAVGYLNRRWNKNKIVDNYPEFISTVSKWLKDRDIELRTKRIEEGVQPERRGDRRGRDQARIVAASKDEISSRQPLKGAPIREGATGPDIGLNTVAEQYAADNGIRLTRQAEYVKVDEDRAKRIAQAFEEMEDAPTDPVVQEAYRDLIQQTRAQYDALIKAGYKFTFFDSKTDPYDGNPYNAMRDLRNNKQMAVYGTYDGYGTLDDFAADLKDPNRIMLQDSGLRWVDQAGKEQIVTNNDLFRAVHDAFGHGLEGAGFRARGEENAWQAHAKLFRGPALRALTTETRGQNSWLNYGPYGAKNRTASVLDTVFADQKMGLMPEFTQREGREGLLERVELPDDMEYEDIARQIAQRIKGSPDGRLPYDWKIGEGSSKNKLNGTPMRGPLRSRTFQIPDNLVEDFLDNDIEDLGRIYLRQIAPDIELKRAFDDVEMTEQISQIEQWYSDAMRAVKSDRERARLEKAKNSDITDIAGMRDRIRGVYAMEDPDNVWHRTGRVARNLNYMRLMGGVVASSVPDVARIFMAEGITKTFSRGLIPLAKNLKSFRVSAAEAKQYGIGVDALMRGRSQIISDIADYTKGGTAFERGVQSLTDNFGRINLMDYWTAGVKQLHAVTMQNSVIDDLIKGKIDKRLSRLGIDDGNATAIGEQLKKYAEKVDGVWLSNARNWDNPELEQLWGAALRKESDRVIVVPGQEKPLFMSTPMGKTILQFRSFMFSSTQRMLIAGLQRQDHNSLGGVLMLTSLGMMSYAFKQKDAKREITDNPTALVIEGIDRSGVLGAIMEVNNTMEKMSSNNFGLRPLLGVDAPAARFASRSIADGLMGPTFGQGIDLVARVANAGLGEDDWTESDTRALRRLLPGQNLTFIRNGFDEVEKAVGDL